MWPDTPPPLPPLRPGLAAELGPDLAPAAELSDLGLPTPPPPDWPRRLLAGLRRLVRQRPGLRHALAACLRCGTCTACCPTFTALPDPHNTPLGRGELLRRVHQDRGHPWRVLAGSFGNNPENLDDDTARHWFNYFWQCTLCGRCVQVCPLGIDTSLIALAGRELLAEQGWLPEPAAKALRRTGRSGNSLGLGPQAWVGAMAQAEAELNRRVGEAVLCPVDERGAEVLFLAPAVDLARQRASLHGYALIFHAAGVSWTTSTWASDALNPGAWLGPEAARACLERVLEAVRQLRPRLVVWGEDGLGWATARRLFQALTAPWRSLDSLKAARPIHLAALTHRLWREGAFAGRLTPEANAGLHLTWHDPCQTARGAGLVEAPRRLLRAVCPRVRELPEAVSGRHTRCCGGGAGLEGPGAEALRLAGVAPRVADLRQVAQDHGVDSVATLCATCRTNLRHGLRHFGQPMRVMGLAQLWGRALAPALAEGDDAHF